MLSATRKPSHSISATTLLIIIIRILVSSFSRRAETRHEITRVSDSPHRRRRSVRDIKDNPISEAFYPW